MKKERYAGESTEELLEYLTGILDLESTMADLQQYRPGIGRDDKRLCVLCGI